MAALAIGRGRPPTATAGAVPANSIGSKICELTKKVAKVAAAVLLTMLIYASFAAGVIGLMILTGRLQFSVETVSTFLNNLIQTVAQSTLNSISNPINLYNSIYNFLFPAAASTPATEETRTRRPIRHVLPSYRIGRRTFTK